MAASKRARTALIVVGGVAMTVAALVIAPSFVNRASRKLYKVRNDLSDIDFDNMGPDIVRKDKCEEEMGNYAD